MFLPQTDEESFVRLLLPKRPLCQLFYNYCLLPSSLPKDEGKKEAQGSEQRATAEKVKRFKCFLGLAWNLSKSAMAELWAAQGDWEGCLWLTFFFFLTSDSQKEQSLSHYRNFLWPKSAINGSQETVAPWTTHHLFFLWHAFHPFNFVIRSSFSAKPGGISPFSFLCLSCLTSFASLSFKPFISSGGVKSMDCNRVHYP